ncbi:MAG: hypothetical protein HC905_15360 [Bacteroidales bacterium]|nr:hypothetical protein [Bacteroidales bacterium]
MAKQKGIIKLEGTIGDIAFYKSQDGHLAREKGGVSGDRIKNDATFARTRENMDEFGRAGAATKLLRIAFRQYLLNSADNRLVSRLTKAMMEVVKADATSTRGQRNVLDGELELLEGFEFNINGNLTSTFYGAIIATIDRATGALQVAVPAFSPDVAVVAPEGATHIRLVSAGAAINFEAGNFEVVTSQSPEIPHTSAQVAASNLLNQLPANNPNPLFLVFGIEFYQQVNGASYALKNGRYNALAIVRVLGL